ncbi:hypothetical protein [Paenibacillus sp. LK1]|uniref:hypothetical protein n=1 Tax=Paenibacillus sp. LK1 TaxID=2053014 RepID=UPI000C175645|nr:hypothetical protein [Paenibacillus sp. LK1]PIH59026.1 hypothetical protein CS562_13860 [Paenibacillus sp. LK1]
MQFRVVLDRDYGEEQTEEVDFWVNVDEEDCYEMAGENPVSISEMKMVAVEYAMNRFFKQNYTMSVGDRVTVVEVEEKYV